MITPEQCDEIRQLIKEKRSFMIGTRGIRIRIHPYGAGWNIQIDRAFCEFKCYDLDVCEDVDFTVLECYLGHHRDYCVTFDLDEYMKVTVI